MLHNIYSWYHTQSDLENLSLEEHEQLSTVHLVVGQQIIREEIITFDADIICGGIHETADGEVMDNVVISNKDRNDHSNPRLFCGIFTTIAGHANVRAIVSTWGWKCHGFVAFSTQGDVSLNGK